MSFLYRDVRQAAGQQHLLEPPGTVLGAGGTQEVSKKNLFESICVHQQTAADHALNVLTPRMRAKRLT